MYTRKQCLCVRCISSRARLQLRRLRGSRTKDIGVVSLLFPQVSLVSGLVVSVVFVSGGFVIWGGYTYVGEAFDGLDS